MATATHSERAALFRSFEEAARRGDWDQAHTIAGSIIAAGIPREPGELLTYRDQLQQSVRVARIARADLAHTLARVNAAARFANGR